MTHTSGPYHPEGTGVYDSSPGIPTLIARCTMLANVNGIENARFLATAPALLDALVRAEQMIRTLVLRGVFSGDCVETAENEAADFRAIVMKAKGLPPKEKD